MHAAELAEQVPVVTRQTSGAEAIRIMAEYRLSGLVVADDRGDPVAVIPGSQLLRLILPRYLDDLPNLAHTFDEESADDLCRRLNDVSLETLLRREDLVAHALPSVLPDDTLIEIASAMSHGHYPLITVREAGGRYLGVLTLSRVMAAIASAAGQDSSLVRHRLESDIINRGVGWISGEADNEGTR